MKNSWDGSSGSVLSFECSKGFSDSANGAYSPASDAMFFSEVVNQMYNVFNSSAMIPLPLIMRVHYGVNYENAFWDGIGPYVNVPR